MSAFGQEQITIVCINSNSHNLNYLIKEDKILLAELVLYSVICGEATSRIPHIKIIYIFNPLSILFDNTFLNNHFDNYLKEVLTN